MNDQKEKSKTAFNQQAATYDTDMKGQHARSLYPILLDRLSHISYHSALDLGCGTGEMMKQILQTDSCYQETVNHFLSQTIFSMLSTAMIHFIIIRLRGMY